MEHDLVDCWRSEERAQPDGWDFSILEGRMRTDGGEPWNLDLEYRQALAVATSVLDMGTGGGEHLATFADALPADTWASEGWPPNVPVARARLEPLGVRVVEYGAEDEDVDAVRMPFGSDRFDLVLDRHEAYSPRELARIIRSGGTFLTQQVGGTETPELDDWLGWERHRLTHVTHQQFIDDLEHAGFRVVDGGEHVGWYEFTDVAALVAYWQLVPWEVPDDFSVDRYREQLLALHRRSDGGPIRLTRIRFWIKATRI